MKVGIVGSEAAKFSPMTAHKAKNEIEVLLSRPGVTEVVSGGCHLGGIEIGKDLDLKIMEFVPKFKSWEHGYKDRNLQIARYSDEVWCITVDRLPRGYGGMVFDSCYHCQTKSHVKSGGCWTVKQARKLGKKGEIIVVEQWKVEVDV